MPAVSARAHQHGRASRRADQEVQLPPAAVPDGPAAVDQAGDAEVAQDGVGRELAPVAALADPAALRADDAERSEPCAAASPARPSSPRSITFAHAKRGFAVETRALCQLQPNCVSRHGFVATCLMAAASARVALREAEAEAAATANARAPRRGRARSRRRSGCSLRDALRGGVLQLAGSDAVPPRPHANIRSCRCGPRRTSSTRTSTRSTRRSSSATTRGCAGRPVIVGGGVVLAASYEAKAYGVRTAMGGREAQRLCPQAIVVPARMEAYSEASKAVFEIFRDTTPLVEGHLDRRGVPRRARDAADRRDAGGDRGAAAAAGARGGRAADHRRRRADEAPGQGGERGRQARRAARRAAGRRARVPAPAAGRAAVGRRAGDRAQAPRARAARRWARSRSSARRRSSRIARPRGGPAPARARAQPRPAARRTSAGGGARSARSARSGGGEDPGRSSTRSLVGLVDRLARRLRDGAARLPDGRSLRLRFDDFTRATRSHTLPEATARTEAMLDDGARAARRRAPADRGAGAHAASGITFGNLTDDGAVQLALPVDGEPARALDATIDDVRDRFGSAAITRAVLLGRDPASRCRCSGLASRSRRVEKPRPSRAGAAGLPATSWPRT